jgi:hypothetical protein
VNAAGDHWSTQDWEPVENNTEQDQLQDLQYVDMGHYDMANDRGHGPLHEHRNHAINNYAGVALDAAQGHAAPLAPVCTNVIFLDACIQQDISSKEINIFDGPARDAAAGPAFLNEWAPQGPVHNVPANEVLRQLAILYLREPNAQVSVLRMEPSHAHGVMVFIALELGNF